MKSTSSRPWFSGRTKVITIASVLAVGFAGATAVSANVGILNAADDAGDVGNLSAAGDLAPPATQIVDVYLPASTAPASSTVAVPVTATDPAAQAFTVDGAGTVHVATTGSGLRLESVEPSAGWTWSLVQPGPTSLTVTFADGTRTLEFTADLVADGTIAAGVSEPVVAPTPATNRPSNGGEHDDDDDEYEGGEDDD